MYNGHKIIINKNRGWRGLAEAKIINHLYEPIRTTIFSFSQAVWEDMLRGYMVFQDDKKYIIAEFNPDGLPGRNQQRSVLIKNFSTDISSVFVYTKEDYNLRKVPGMHYSCIYNFNRNRNNHTTSDWNCIGIRVVPMI